MNDMKNDTTNDIIIDLTQDLSPDTIKVTELIHQESFERLADLITKALPGTSNAHNKVFFIDGTRGAGKSTFLAAVSKALPEKLKGISQTMQSSSDRPNDDGNGRNACNFPHLGRN